MHCVAPSCNNDSGCTSSQEISYFEFPAEPALRAAWLAAGWRPQPGGAVCSQHFLWQNLLQSGGRRVLRPGAVPVTGALVCRTCLATDCNLYSMAENKTLSGSFESLTGLMMEETCEQSLPPFLCDGCSQWLLACARFRAMSLRAHSVLLEMVSKKHWIRVESIQSIIGQKSLLRFDQNRSESDQCDYDIEHSANENIYQGVCQYKQSDTKSVLNLCEEITEELCIKAEDDNESHYEPLGDEKFVDGDIPCGDATHTTVAEGVKLKDIDELSAGEDTKWDSSPPLQEVKQEAEAEVSTDRASQKTKAADLHVDLSQYTELVDELLTNKQLSCDICNYQSDSVLLLINHLKGHAAHEPIKGDACNYEILNKGSLSRHVENNSDDKPYSCDVCSKSFSRNDHFINHFRLHSGEKPYACNVCSKSFSKKYLFINHFRKHSGEKPYVCEVCSKSFSRKDHFINHFRIHSGEKPYACNVCSKSFSNKSDMSRHSQIHSDKKPFSCDICSKSFSTNRYMSRHMRIHSDEKPYSCDICGKSFASKRTLKLHLRVHSGKKPHSCNVCDKSFYTKTHLKLHFRVHSGEKPYSCDICDKAFVSKYKVKLHLRVHSGDKPHSCDVCSKKFSRKGNLTKHSRIHSLHSSDK